MNRLSVFLHLVTLCLTFFINGVQTRPITSRDIVEIVEIKDPQISPDGNVITFVVWQAIKNNNPSTKRQSDIWIVAADGSKVARPFLCGPNEQRMPRWSPDGTYVAFLATTDNDSFLQIFLYNNNDRTIKRITSVKTGVIKYKWFPDSKRIAFTSAQSFLNSQTMRSPASKTTNLNKSDEFARLYEIDITNLETTLLSNVDENVNDFDISPDGTRCAMCISSSSDINQILYFSRLVVKNLDGSDRSFIATIAGDLIMSINLGNVRWSPDGKNLLYFERYGSVYTMLPTIISSDGNVKKNLAHNYMGTIWDMDWFDSGQSFLVSSQEGVQGIIGMLDLQTGRVQPLTKTGICWGWPNNWSVDRAEKKIVFKNAHFDSPEDLWIMNSDGSNKKRLTHMNPQVNSLDFGREHVLNWNSYDGTEIEGILITPIDYKKGNSYPLITIIHGGPEWAWWSGWHASWHEWVQLLASNGYAVFLPNPRGSDGYGWEFVEKNRKDWGGGDFDDIMSGIDYLVNNNIADPERLGIGGWSYGGYMTAWAVTQTNRFKAAVMGAGMTDLVKFYKITPCPSCFDAYFGGNPDAQKQLYLDKSPINYIKNIHTPILILHGENDAGVPVSQACEFYQALCKRGVESECHVYPREGHHFAEQGHQIDSLQRILVWFNVYLK